MATSLDNMTKGEFNQRFLLELNRYYRKLKHLGTGTSYNHPLFRWTLLDNVKADIEFFGFDQAKQKWAAFIGWQ